MIQFIKSWEHPKLRICSLLFFLAYLIGFSYLEEYTPVSYHYTTLPIDYAIPVIEPFVLAYYFWFFYCFATMAYFFFKNESDYLMTFRFLWIGMAIFLLISAIYPTALDLRPTTFSRDNIFTKMLTFMYSIDTSTNVFPSIHVYNSIGIHCSLMHSQTFRNNRKLHTASLICCILIILSTIFIKQHSIIDVIGGIGLAAIVYLWIYIIKPKIRHA